MTPSAAEFDGGFPSIEPQELVTYLLAESGQSDRQAVNPLELLAYLGLRHVSLDFHAELPREVTAEGRLPRALLSTPDRLIATDASLQRGKVRSGVFHEIAHFVLPDHGHAIYLDDDECLSFQCGLSLEREANEFAAALMFKGDEFTREACTHPVTAASVKALASRYLNPVEATCRRFVSRNPRPVLMATLWECGQAAVDVDAEVVWSVRDCVTSATFRGRHSTRIDGVVPPEIVGRLLAPGGEVASSVVVEAAVRTHDGTRETFRAEYFSDGNHIFCLLTPE